MKRVIWIMTFCAALVGGAVDASERARGIVFEDTNRNLERDRGEPGVAGVSVSNGQDVVVTDGEGEYALDVEEGDIVFITKPRGYMTPVNEYNLPGFYYIHRPHGTPAALGLRFRGLDPTGPLPASIDFPLVRTEDPNDFNVVWFSDPQPQTWMEVDFVRDDVVSELIGVDAAFGITTGDIMYDDLSLIPRQNAVVAQIGVPWYNVPGNHEIDYPSPDNERSMETFKQYFGPPYYSFDYGQVHFIAIRSVTYLGKGEKRNRLGARVRGGYVGGIDDKQLVWLENDLATVPKEKLIVLAMHIPFRSNVDPDDERVNIRNGEAVFRLLEGFPKVFSVAGHMHTTYHNYFGSKEGYHGKNPLHEHVIATVSGSWWSGPMDDRGIPVTHQMDGTPNGYYIMFVRGTDFAMRFKASGQSEYEQMRILLDTAYHATSYSNMLYYRPGQLMGTTIHEEELFAARVIVNLFDGGPGSVVEYTIGDHDAVMMEPVFEPDPFIAEHYMRNAKEYKNWVKPDICQHLWAAPLPSDMLPGTYTLTVRALDEYEQMHVAHKIVEVIPSGYEE